MLKSSFMKKNPRQRYSPKPKQRNTNKKGKPPNQNKQKGSLLEQIVALMYKTPGVELCSLTENQQFMSVFNKSSW